MLIFVNPFQNRYSEEIDQSADDHSGDNDDDGGDNDGGDNDGESIRLTIVCFEFGESTARAKSTFGSFVNNLITFGAVCDFNVPTLHFKQT